MGGIWFSNTRHLDPKVPGGEGRVLAMRYQSPEPEGNRKRETAGRGSSPHHRGGGEMGGFWPSDTRYLDPMVPGGEGGYWFCDTRHLDPKVTGGETQRGE